MARAIEAMRESDYPPQEPLSDFARPYRDACVERSTGISFGEIAYGDDPYQRVAIYPAPRPNGTVLAFVHGGGWTSGYKEWMGFMAPALATQGVLFASIGYRLAPAHVFPAGLDDVAAAIAAIEKSASRWGGDGRRLFIGGHSAGGHYTSLLAVRRDWQSLHGLPHDAIRGCLPISGVYRFGAGSGLSMRPRFLGPESAALERAASPILNIQGTPPPFLIAHGDRDFPHLVTQAVEMEAALRAAGGAVERLVLAGCDHLGASLAAGDANGPWVPRAADFMARH